MPTINDGDRAPDESSKARAVPPLTTLFCTVIDRGLDTDTAVESAFCTVLPDTVVVAVDNDPDCVTAIP